jgi:hypothetical protein
MLRQGSEHDGARVRVEALAIRPARPVGGGSGSLAHGSQGTASGTRRKPRDTGTTGVGPRSEAPTFAKDVRQLGRSCRNANSVVRLGLTRSGHRRLFDDLIAAGWQPGREFDPERLRRFEIQGQTYSRNLLNRHVGRSISPLRTRPVWSANLVAPIGLAGRPEKREYSRPFGSHLENPGSKPGASRKRARWWLI